MLRYLLACWLFLATHGAVADDGGLLGVNEGSSSSSDFAARQMKYQPFADYLGRVTNKQVKLESAQNLKLLATNLKTGRFDFLVVRPAHLSAMAMRDQKYVLVATARGAAVMSFIVPKDSPLKRSSDLVGKSIAMPDENAYPSRVGLAMLREAGFKSETMNIRHFRTQEAVGYAVEQKLMDAGVVVSYSKVAQEWETKGHRVLWKSKPLPYWCMIASPKLPPETVASVREALLKLGDTAEGARILKDMGIEAFEAGRQQDYLDLLTYLKE
jgi:phosphonate transport system substrate-binding protein